jgi:RimJ/RimL family protein N-acetyltransferase
MNNLNFEIRRFDDIILLLKPLNIVKGDRETVNSTMFMWTHFTASLRNLPPQYVAVCMEGDRVIGWSGVGNIGKINGFGNISTYVIPEFRGQGIATELVKLAVGNYAKRDLERKAIVLEMENNSDEIKRIIEGFGLEALPLVEDKYDYINDEIWDGRNVELLTYHKYLTLKVIGCECSSCLIK